MDKFYQEAIEYFKKAAELRNFPADIECAKCLMNLKRTSECLDHLHEMLQKYKDDINNGQVILLHIAMLSYEEHDIEKACVKFLEAIQLDKQSNRLKV